MDFELTLPRPTLGQLLVGGAFVAALFAYPLLGEVLLARYGVHVVAAGLFGATAVIVALRAARALRGEGPGAILTLLGRYAGPLALLGLAWASGDRLYLLLFPALVNLMLAALFGSTLFEEQSIVERVARGIHPYLPEFTRRYCHTTTGMWVAFFVASAVVIAWYAVFEPERWRFFATSVYLGLIALLSALEFVFRKVWFRYYGRGPVDRALARLFPSESTERGRRSVAYIQRMRELGY